MASATADTMLWIPVEFCVDSRSGLAPQSRKTIVAMSCFKTTVGKLFWGYGAARRDVARVSLGLFRGGACCQCAIDVERTDFDTRPEILLIHEAIDAPKPEKIPVYKLTVTFYSSIREAEKVTLSLGDDIYALVAKLITMVENPRELNARLVLTLEDKPIEREFRLFEKFKVWTFCVAQLAPFVFLPKEESRFYTPVNDFDMLEHMTTTLLCMNRKLGEKGLSRKIAGFHKDLLVEDVMNRLVTIHWASRRFAAITNDAGICHEIFHYLNYYKCNGAIIDKSCHVFFALINESYHFDYMPLIIQSVGRVLLSHVVSHPDQDHAWFFCLLEIALAGWNGAWLNDYIDEALDHPTIRKRVPSMMSQSGKGLPRNVSRRPDSRHYFFVRSFLPNARFPDYEQ